MLLSGGWNRHLSDYSSLQNVLQFHGMLKHVGFHEDNIKVFFANGVAPQHEQEGALFSSHASKMKPVPYRAENYKGREKKNTE